LRAQGRYIEPVVRRVLHFTKHERVERLCHRLLATDFVTEVRSALYAPVDGSRPVDNPIQLRAQLAGLLRDVGLDDEAKVEGRRVLAELRPRVDSGKIDPHHDLRSLARATEAVGDDRGAADYYA